MSNSVKALVGVIVLFGVWKLVFAPNVIRSEVAWPLHYREQVVGPSSGGALPMVIALHGAGAHEKDLDGVFEGFSTAVRVVSFRAPVKSGGGYVWAEGRGENRLDARHEHDRMFREVGASIAASVPELVSRYPTRGRPTVFGFSQGGAMAWYLGAHHPEAFGAVFPVAGELSRELLEGASPSPRTPFVAYHGRADSVVSFGGGERTLRALERLGALTEWVPHPGRHTVPPEVIADLERRLAALPSS